MIPFLKTKHEVGVSTPDEVKMRKSDDEEEGGYELLDAVVEDMLEAFHKKDKGMLKMALEALIDHIKEEDEIQDAEEEKFEE